MATYNLFLNAPEADSAITNSYNLFHPDGLTGQNISLYGGNINHWGIINSTQLYITGGVGEESFINRLTGGIRVEGDCEFDSIVGGISIGGTSYIENLTGGLFINNGGINVVGDSVNNGSFRNAGPVSILGPTSITGFTEIVGNTEIRGNYFQSGAFNVVSNFAEFKGNLDVTGSLDVYGPFEVDGPTTITATGGFTVSGPTTVNGDSTLNGTTNIVGELQLNGQPFFTQQLNQITEVNYFLTGGECVELLTGLTTGQGQGAVIQTSNTGLVARNEGPSVNGNTRGDYSVDLQLSRNLATQVAGGKNSVLIGGASNTASGAFSSVIGGSGNRNFTSASSVIGGFGNITSGDYSSVIGGTFNTVSGVSNAIIGGTLNTGGGNLSSIVGGRQNILSLTSDESSIIGGFRNVQSGKNNAIIGGTLNKMSYKSQYSTILGGDQNTISSATGLFEFSNSNSIIGGYKNKIGSNQNSYQRATIIGGSFGEVFNNSERVLSNPVTNDAGTESTRKAQLGELVLPLYTNGSFGNGGSDDITNTGLYIPSNTLIAFKGFGAVNAEFVELKGTVTNSSFQLLANDVLNNNTITGGISTGSNSWSLYLVTPPLNLTGTLYLEMVYMPFADPYEDPYGDPYGGFAFNSDASLGTLFS
jgi:hypothetical protein